MSDSNHPATDPSQTDQPSIEQLLAEYATNSTLILEQAIYDDTLLNALPEAELPVEIDVATPSVELSESLQQEPVAEEPVAEEPVSEEPVSEEPVSEEPVAEDPVAEGPVAEESVAEESVAEGPVAEESVAEESVAEESVAEESVAEESVAEESVAEESVAEESVAEVPVAEVPVAEVPVAEVPVAEIPVAEVPVAIPVKRQTVEEVVSKEPAEAQVASETKATEVAAVGPNEPAAAPVATVEKKSTEPTFLDLDLSTEVQQAIQISGYEKPSAVQSSIIPYMLEGRDVLAQSQTGTGKTAAFALPILSNLEIDGRRPQVIVLTPTRELAIQVARSFSTYGTCMPKFNVAAIYGGQDYEVQFRQLRNGVHVVVGTPGRMIDHIQRGTLKLDGVQTLVLDEADEMLNMGFLEDVEFVLDRLPNERQIALFSATMPEPIRKISERYLNDPAKITIKKKTMTVESVRQRALFVPPREKVDTLLRLLEVEETEGVIVFTKTKDATITVAEQLTHEGLQAAALNGDMPQKVRERTIEQLKSGRLDVLVATDVAARGLDVSRISHVFNFDLPHDSESYVHRIGRTGRAGRSGEAIIFLTHQQRNKLRLIERATKQKIEIVDPPTANDINAMRVKRFKQGITDITADQDLTMFKELIQQYVEESGKPMEIVAAALAQIAQNGRPFMMKERRATKGRPGKREREEGRNGGSRRESFGGRSDERNNDGPRQSFGGGEFTGRRDRGPRGGGEGRSFGPPEPGMTRYRIAVGRRDGVKPGNIVGAVANEAGIEGEYIGPIKINDGFSTIDLPEGMPREIFDILQGTRVAGKQLRLSLMEGEDRPIRKPRFNGKGDGPGPKGRKPGKNKGFRGVKAGKKGRAKA